MTNTDFEIPRGEINGFSHPILPIISDVNPNNITEMQWGLIPSWAKDKSFQKNTLNCMIETAAEKPSFKNSISKRCLVIADGFYEWKHTMVNGKLIKTKYRITVPENNIFTFAGIFNNWNGLDTFTILTTEGNELMAEIHNSKKRMPVVLLKEEEELWLNHEPIQAYAIRKEVELIATPII